MQIQCTQCGADFAARPSAIKAGKRFCTIRCRADAVIAANRSETWPPITPSALRRFWSRFEQGDGCWEWQGTREYYGHGRLTVGEYVWKAHRLAWTLKSGPIPEGMGIFHTCDNPPCVRHDDEGTYEVEGRLFPRWGHLWLGTQADNIADMQAKGRAHAGRQFGEQNGSVKTTSDVVAEIRARYRKGVITHAELGVIYDLSGSQVGRILKGVRWPHITTPDPAP